MKKFTIGFNDTINGKIKQGKISFYQPTLFNPDSMSGNIRTVIDNCQIAGWKKPEIGLYLIS